MSSFIKGMLIVAVVIGLYTFFGGESLWERLTEPTKSELKVEVAKKAKDIANLKETLVVQEKTNSVVQGGLEDNRKAVVEVLEKKQTAHKQTAVIQKKQETKLVLIRQNTVLSAPEKAHQEAEADIDMLWENFCRIDSTTCPKAT